MVVCGPAISLLRLEAVEWALGIAYCIGCLWSLFTARNDEHPADWISLEIVESRTYCCRGGTARELDNSSRYLDLRTFAHIPSNQLSSDSANVHASNYSDRPPLPVSIPIQWYRNRAYPRANTGAQAQPK